MKHDVHPPIHEQSCSHRETILPMCRRHRSTLGRVLLLVSAWAGLEACSPSGQQGEITGQTSQAVTDAGSSDPVPCAAWSYSAVANTGNIMINSPTLIDSYQSSGGAYGGGNVGSSGIVQAATTITNNGGLIHAVQRPNTPSGFSVVPVPAGAINLPLGSSTPGSLNINIAADSITLAPGDYVASNINVNFPGAITISPAGPVRIWVTGNLNLGGNENLDGTPKNLAFLVTGSGWVNVNSSGALYGMIYAPTSGINVNSKVFGSVIGSSLVMNSGAAVHYDVNSTCAPPPQAFARPRTLPQPPRDVGCYLGTANGWKLVPCTTLGDLKETFQFPQVYPAIVPAALPQTTIPFEFGELESTIVSFDNEADVSRDGTTSTSDTLSLQLNTNRFAGNGGDEGWVQFVVQTDATDSAVCLWNVDTTVACQVVKDNVCINGDGYQPHCLGGSTDTTKNRVGKRAGHFKNFDYATVGGSVYKDSTNKPVIGMVARFSWYDPADDFVDANNGNGLYSVVVDDTLGLAGKWNNVNGTLMGIGNGSKATFGPNSSVLTRMLAGSCLDATSTVASIPWPGACPTQPVLLPHTALGTADDTAESNNLTQVGAINALASVTPDLVFTEFLASTSGACQAGNAPVYVRDNPDDTGAVPSNLGGQAFWESPDLFVVPAGATVDPAATPSETVVQPGQPYDFWVRVNNDYGCNDVSEVKARVNVADPTALSVDWDQGQVTGNQYLGDLQADGTTKNTGGITVKAGQRALVGPFHWLAPTTNLGDSHKCALASIVTPGESAPDKPTDAPDSPQVAQRNLQLTECAFPLTNGTTSDGKLSLTLTVSSGVTPDLSNVGMTFQDPSGEWGATWVVGAGAAYTVTHDAAAGTTTVQLGQPSIKLPPVTLLAGQTETATGVFNLGQGDPDTTLQLAATLTSSSNVVLAQNGGTCVRAAPGVVK